MGYLILSNSSGAAKPIISMAKPGAAVVAAALGYTDEEADLCCMSGAGAVHRLFIRLGRSRDNLASATQLR